MVNAGPPKMFLVKETQEVRMELEHISHSLALDLAFKSSNTQKQAQETSMHAREAPTF